MGSSAGIIRFDGVTFERYQPLQGKFPEKDVYVTKAVPGGGLWIGWRIGGASLLRDGVVRNFTAADGLPKGSIWGFAYDQGGGVWAAGMGGLARFDGERWQRMGPEPGYTAQKASTVFVDREGTVAAFSEQGLFLMPKGATRFQPPVGKLDARQPPQQGPDGSIYFLEEQGIRIFASLARYEQADAWIYRVTTVLRGHDGAVWFGTDGAVLRQDAAGRVQRIGYPPGVDSVGHVHKLMQDADGALWGAIVRTGVFRYRDGRLPVDTTFSMLDDSQGRAWFGYVDNRIVMLERGAAAVSSGAGEGLAVGRVATLHELHGRGRRRGAGAGAAAPAECGRAVRPLGPARYARTRCPPWRRDGTTAPPRKWRARPCD
jgi:ligand-binding sensor domain-containing protein